MTLHLKKILIFSPSYLITTSSFHLLAYIYLYLHNLSHKASSSLRIPYVHPAICKLISFLFYKLQLLRLHVKSTRWNVYPITFASQDDISAMEIKIVMMQVMNNRHFVRVSNVLQVIHCWRKSFICELCTGVVVRKHLDK